MEEALLWEVGGTGSGVDRARHWSEHTRRVDGIRVDPLRRPQEGDSNHLDRNLADAGAALLILEAYTYFTASPRQSRSDSRRMPAKMAERHNPNAVVEGIRNVLQRDRSCSQELADF